MTKPRAQQVSLSATPYYHCISRCVRKAFLCGKNYSESKDYSHRRDWIEARLFQLSQVFMIDIVSYAIMSNHYHVILSVNQTEALDLSDKEVVERWHRLFRGSAISQDYVENQEVAPSYQPTLQKTITKWRERLSSISWFMRCMNENIARRANEEDNCTGRFWEGRFKSQALLDDKALLACMAYVDLNPIRAKMAESLEDSDYTSIKRRLDSAKAKKVVMPECTLMPFYNESIINNQRIIPSSFEEYLQLIEWTGGELLQHKSGKVSNQANELLAKLGIKPNRWLYLSENFESLLKTVVGGLTKLDGVYRDFSIKRIAGKSFCGKYLGL